ncbi:acyltransferase family protein [Paenibacillus sp. TRM 82003]|uniref:acyltransferase family protein n=1 Tax=Kineococcus sp. TRM81007 TaxID=2925831 RepID=UPI001F574372|nr:acyltransferase family protein [Kineococcus sp. TRM81007]MCI2237718.1 acyltransferase family protein [Kineococcus sp. TRM81007]MCI3921736.1 acyltransferase family protein [Paenibacillus sp. TRM 82003]
MRPPPLRAGPAGRLPALDVARGVAIALVVLHHAVLHLDAAGLLPAWWRAVNGELVLLRMPLFFCVSGVLASSAAGRSWGALVRGRLVTLLWVFVLWSLVRFAVFSAVTPRFQPWETDSLVPLLLAPVRPTTGLWYLYALAVFTVAARALGRRAPWLLVPAALLSVAASELWVRAPYYVWHQMARCFVFFLLGWCLRGLLLRLLTSLGTVPAAVLSAVGAAALVAHGAGGLRAPGAASALSVLAVVCGLAFAVLLARAPGVVGAGAGWLGRRTLPVYLAHELVVGVATSAVVAAAAATGVAPGVATGVAVGAAGGARPWWAPLLWTVLGVVVPLVLHALALRVGARWLYEAPSAVRGAGASARRGAGGAGWEPRGAPGAPGPSGRGTP